MTVIRLLRLDILGERPTHEPNTASLGIMHLSRDSQPYHLDFQRFADAVDEFFDKTLLRIREKYS